MKKQVGFLEVDASTNIGAQLAALTPKMNLWEGRMNMKQVISFGFYQDDHHTDQCQLTSESVNFVGKFGKQGNFNAGWRGENQ